MKVAEIVSASAAIGRTRSRKAKTELIASCLRGLRPEEVPIAVAYLSGRLPQGTIGVGRASLRDPPPAPESPAPRLYGAAVARVKRYRTYGMRASDHAGVTSVSPPRMMSPAPIGPTPDPWGPRRIWPKVSAPLGGRVVS